MRTHRRILGLLLLGYLFVTVAYGVVNPLFEAPDEYFHYFTVQYIADNGKLPIAQTPETAVYIEQEAAQPPLYYWLGSWLIRPIDTRQAKNDLWLNPRVQMGDASAATNINRVVHDRAAEAFPWTNYILAAHILRLFSTLFGLGTLLVLYATARKMWPDSPRLALFAVGLVAFLPQFNFLHSYVNNDVAIIFFASLALYLLVRVWDSAEIPPRASQIMLLGLVVGLAMLSKTTGLLLFVYAVGFLGVYGLFFKHSLAQITRMVSLFGAMTLVVAGWLLWRNGSLYGDITAANQFIAIAGGDKGFTFVEILQQSGGIWRSLIAVFGWFNVLPSLWVYRLWGSVVVLALLATIAQLVQKRPRLLAVLLAGWIAVVYAGMVVFMLRTPAAQGRLLLPAIVPLVLPLAVGLDRWLGWLGSKIVWGLGGLPLVTLYCLFGVIRPIYTPHTVTTIPPEATPLNVELVDNLVLKAANLWITPYFAGDNVPIELYWQATAALDQPYEIVVELFGRDNTPIGKLQTYHGGGLYPNIYWPKDQIIDSKIGVRLNADIVVPTQARVNVRVVGAGEGVDIGYVEIEPREWPRYAVTHPLATIGEGIELVSAEINTSSVTAGDTIEIALVWHVTQPPNRFLTTLLHLGFPDQQPIAQGDAAPLNGDYPTTFWQTGEVIEDRYTLTIPTDALAGEYPIRIGMYDEAIERVQLSAEGILSPDFTYTIGTITLAEK
ncbi:MAG TPA: glycosyltransferase family 39 protein [Anaerolineae bacterium]|nr:glycosyltransferase family 39 protein [Anaerolineae bacterium]